MVGPGLKVLAVTHRPAVELLVRRVGERGACAGLPLKVDVVTAAAMPSAAETALEYAAALVDVCAGAEGADGADDLLQTCRALREAEPCLPIIALICCDHALTAWDQQCLLEHVDTVLDLHATEDELLFTLRSLTRRRGMRSGWAQVRHALRAPRVRDRSSALRISAEDARLLGLLAQGLNNRELATLTNMSRHGIDHWLKRLCLRLGVRSRVELAAWSGRHGLYPSRRPLESNLPIQASKRSGGR
jgi:DNA-binding NarL/FixJ family response regulator